jgi:hypothetical protein
MSVLDIIADDPYDFWRNVLAQVFTVLIVLFLIWWLRSKIPTPEFIRDVVKAA